MNAHRAQWAAQRELEGFDAARCTEVHERCCAFRRSNATLLFYKSIERSSSLQKLAGSTSLDNLALVDDQDLQGRDKKSSRSVGNKHTWSTSITVAVR